MRILIVQGEKRLTTIMKDALTEAKYFSDLVEDVETGLDYARSGIYDCLIFDDTCPLIHGKTAVELLQEECIPTPILLLSGKSNSTVHTLKKPFKKEELLHCLRNILYPTGDKAEISFGDLTLRLEEGILCCGELSVSLSAREYELARLLMCKQDTLLPKETIFLKIWGYDSETESNVVEAYVSFLRRKLRSINSTVQLQAVRRKGYHLVEEKATS